MVLGDPAKCPAYKFRFYCTLREKTPFFAFLLMVIREVFSHTNLVGAAEFAANKREKKSKEWQPQQGG